MISSSAPELLPPPEELEQRCRAMAVLDSIVCPLFDARQFRFDGSHEQPERVARHDNYEGDGWLIWFTTRGVVIRGFWHESPLSPWALNADAPTPWPNLFVGLPERLQGGPRMMIDGVEAVTFCLWWDADEPRWRAGRISFIDPDHADPDGSQWLMGILSGPHAYQQFAEEVYERHIDLNTIERLYRHEPLTADLVRRLGEDADLDLATTVARAAGYPLSP